MSNGNRVRPPYADYAKFLRRRNAIDRIAQRHAQADDMFRRLGITFAVYGQEEQDERLIPFDVVPRIIAKQEWDLISKGCCQRVTALNHFIADVYGKKEIFKAGEVPRALLKNNAEYCKEMEGFTPPGGIYTHISGVDLVRTDEDDFYVLEDNLRCPSGVSYMLENRDVMTRLFPDLFDQLPVAPVSHYPADLLAILRSTAPSRVIDPTVVVLTPGRFNSAYFEHAFLADEMGVELVEGKDLYVRKNHVFMRTIDGPQRVDVIYRRINDDFLDPKQFNKDSMLGVPGLFQAYRSGKVTIANAVGNGIADDKAVYDYVPEMIRYYLNEEPVLKNVPTFHLKKKSERDEVLDKITSMVIKEVHGAGGYRDFFDWVKERVHAVRGLIYGVMLQQSAFAFHRVGTFIERADNTARLVDVKFHVLSARKQDKIEDYYRWGALLRSLSAFKSYRTVYRDAVRPMQVVELLLLNPDFPRSLNHCTGVVSDELERLAPDTRGAFLAKRLHQQFSKENIDAVVRGKNLHDVLENFTDASAALSNQIAKDFLLEG